MGIANWILNKFGYAKMDKKETPAGIIEKEFGALPAASRDMEDNACLWYAMYTGHPPWETCDVHSIGLAGAIGRELSNHVLTEFSVTVSGSERADYINKQLQAAAKKFGIDLEIGLCLGGIALKPYIVVDRILVDASATNFTPTRFDGDGKAVSGVFKSKPVRSGRDWYVRLEYHDFRYTEDGGTIYTVENKAFRSGQNGGIGAPVALNVVDEWTGIEERQEIAGLSGPLFAYFKPPVANRVEPESDMGVSVYSGEVADLIRQAEEQWARLWWEFQSGERKIYMDGTSVNAGQFNDRLFERGNFTSTGNLFEPYSPEFRNNAIYDGFQYILKIIEFCVGLAFGTISDPQSVNKTATEEIMTKHRQYITEGAIQKAFQDTLDGLIYAMDAMCDLYGLAPDGEYETTYNWGDGILDDPETKRQDMAMGIQLMNAAVMGPLEYRMKYFGEDEKTAIRMLPDMESMAT